MPESPERLDQRCEKKRNEKGEFSPKSALFVRNRWDQIPQREIEEAKNYVIRKLDKCWRVPSICQQKKLMPARN